MCIIVEFNSRWIMFEVNSIKFATVAIEFNFSDVGDEDLGKRGIGKSF